MYLAYERTKNKSDQLKVDTLYKIQYPFMSFKKISKTTRNRRKLLQPDKGIYENLQVIAYLIIKAEYFPP